MTDLELLFYDRPCRLWSLPNAVRRKGRAVRRTISLTSLIDLSLASPNERVRRVADTRQLYSDSDDLGFDPDFYAPIKDLVRSSVRAGDPTIGDDVLERYHDDRRRYRSYLACVEGFRGRWLKRKPTWVGDPKLTRHAESGLAVRVNPELWVAMRLAYEAPGCGTSNPQNGAS